jgi:hypothetical protein
MAFLQFNSQRFQEGFVSGSKNLSKKWILAALVNSITLFCLNPNSKIQQKSPFTREVQHGNRIMHTVALQLAHR